MASLLTETNLLIEGITNLLVRPLLILFLGIILGKILQNLVLRLGKATELDRHSRHLLGQTGLTELIAGAIAAVVYTIAVVWALVAAHIVREAAFIVAGALAMMALFAIVLWVADLFPNLIAGWRMKRRPKNGRTFSGAGVKGTVEHAGPLAVRLRTKDGFLIVIPNKALR